MLAVYLGTPEAKLRVVAPDVGGGFGLKAQLFMEEILIPHVARQLERPVKWIEDRYEHMAASAHSKNVTCYIEIAVKDDGTFLAFRGRYIGDGGAYVYTPWSIGIDAAICAVLLPSIYSVRDVAYTTDNALTNKCPNGPYRGVGWTPGHAARESLIDDIARAMDIDPVELRLRNVIGPEPYTSATGLSYDGGSYAESIRKAQEILDYDGFRKRQAELREQGRYIGVGFSPFVEPTAYGSKIAKASRMDVTFFDSMSVTVHPDGSVVVASGQHSHGQAHATVFAQVVADRLGVKFEDITFVQGDTSNSPYGMGTFASRSAVIGGGAVMYAANDVREKLLKLAGAMMEVSPEDVELAQGKATVRGVPDKSVTIGEIAMFSYYGGEKRPEMDEQMLTSTRSYDPPQTYGNGTVVAIVEVDIETGHVDLQRMVAVEDCGVMLNPMIVDGQVHGAISQGIGGAMYEHCAYDPDGNFTAGTLMDYLLPSSMEVPAMDVQHIETPSVVTEGGMKGCGEAGMVSTPASIVNAVADALSPFGVTIDQTPVTPDYVRELLRNGSNGATS